MYNIVFLNTPVVWQTVELQKIYWNLKAAQHKVMDVFYVGKCSITTNKPGCIETMLKGLWISLESCRIYCTLVIEVQKVRELIFDISTLTVSDFKPDWICWHLILQLILRV